ncbi:MAG: PQQ-dependent sugar dehydrogenase [Pirellulaceae bacterium]|nr:PQQ-dependent sugar dehydrogenase [Pirellulaceae bacterium]
MNWMRTCLAVICLSLPRAFAWSEEPPPPQEPQIAPASKEAEQAISGFKVPAGMKVEVFAAEPLLANPVAFFIDHRGRFFVCETFRQTTAIADNRNHAEWLDDDLAAQTVADRLAYIHKHLKAKAAEYTQQDDRIRLLEDTNGDGKADKATVFAAGFNKIEDGTGAGVLVRGDDVYYTNIPNLWRLRDMDKDGKAEERTALHTGYGVRFAFRGHDMHGLILGPDGRLYFSIGDRGFNVKTQEGKQIVHPQCGAVLRCELDGSKLEVFATGLRNTQELAFDDYGNLFTGDNNSDSGDQARWV